MNPDQTALLREQSNLGPQCLLIYCCLLHLSMCVLPVNSLPTEYFFFLSADYFQNQFFFSKSPFRNSIRLSNILDPAVQTVCKGY